MKWSKLYLLFMALSTSIFMPAQGTAIQNEAREIAIIGSGPAGLSAAIIAAQADKSVVLLTGPDIKGSFQFSQNPKNWPTNRGKSGNEIMERLLSEINELKKEGNIQIIESTLTSLSENSNIFTCSTEDGKTFHAKSVIIATGSSPKKLDPSSVAHTEDFRGTTLLNTFKKEDTSWHGSRIVVVGGGEDALKKTSKLAKHAKTITLIVRGKELKASKKKIDALMQEKNVRILYNSTIASLEGSPPILTAVRLTQSDSTKAPKIIGCDYVIEALGLVPNSQPFTDLVECDKNGYIKITEATKSSKNGIFAAGTVADPIYQQAVIASTDGVKAAYDAIRYLKEKK